MRIVIANARLTDCVFLFVAWLYVLPHGPEISAWFLEYAAASRLALNPLFLFRNPAFGTSNDIDLDGPDDIEA